MNFIAQIDANKSKWDYVSTNHMLELVVIASFPSDDALPLLISLLLLSLCKFLVVYTAVLDINWPSTL